MVTETSATILAVDDEAGVREALAVRLSQTFDAHVLGAADNAEALTHLRRSRVDLIVQDLVRPGGTGMELLKALREEPWRGTIPVIVLSAAARCHGDEALSEGARAVLAKPCEADSLLSAVRQVLGVATAGR